MQQVTAKDFKANPGMAPGHNGNKITIPISLGNIASQFNVVRSHFNSLNTRFTNFCNNANERFKDIRNDMQTIRDTVTANNQALNAALAQDRNNTQQSIQRVDQDIAAHGRTIQAQAGNIDNIQQRIVASTASTDTLQAQVQEERARRDLLDNQVQQLQGRFQELNQAQAAVIETKVKLAQVEQQNAIQYKLLQEDNKELKALKQELLDFAHTIKEFQQTCEKDKREVNEKNVEQTLQISQLRELVAKGSAASESNAVTTLDLPEPIEVDEILLEGAKDTLELIQLEVKLADLMAAGGPQGDIPKIEWQTQALVRLQARQKVAQTGIKRQQDALKGKLQQLMRSHEAFKKMEKQKLQENASQIAQLREEIAEMKAKKSQEGIKKIKRQRSLVDVNPAKSQEKKQ